MPEPVQRRRCGGVRVIDVMMSLRVLMYTDVFLQMAWPVGVILAFLLSTPVHEPPLVHSVESVFRKDRSRVLQ